MCTIVFFAALGRTDAVFAAELKWALGWLSAVIDLVFGEVGLLAVGGGWIGKADPKGEIACGIWAIRICRTRERCWGR